MTVDGKMTNITDNARSHAHAVHHVYLTVCVSLVSQIAVCKSASAAMLRGLLLLLLLLRWRLLQVT